MELRPYQQAAREAVENRWEQGDDSTLLSIPTGCGKTVIFAKIAEDRVRQGDRVLISSRTAASCSIRPPTSCTPRPDFPARPRKLSKAVWAAGCV